MLLLVGAALILGSIVSLYVGLTGVPAGRVPKERLAAFTTTEHRNLLTRLTDAVVGGVDAVLRRRGWRPFSAEELELAGVATPVASLVVLICSMSFVGLALTFVVLKSVWFALLVAVLVPVGARFWIKHLVSRRRKRFADQMPQMLQMTAASLRAGHSLSRALDVVSREADAPMSEEVARVVNEYRLGRDLVEAMESVAERMKSRDFSWVAGAIAAQRESGGNLNEILDQVAETIRERTHIRQQVVALSAEGRLSAYILMALPVGIGGYYAIVSGETMGLFVESTAGRLLLIGSLVLYVAGGFWMRSIVRIEF
jgi:tight adherence protein B